MRVLLDQGLPRSAATLLREAGHDAVHTAECGLARAPDDEILQAARRQDRIAVTLDADFHTSLALEGASTPSVIRIRIEGLRGPEVASLILRVMDLCESDLAEGAAITVKPASVRIHHLPIAGSSPGSEAE
jgi:predicted nuclease of predicted toxin-antitoxin system